MVLGFRLYSTNSDSEMVPVLCLGITDYMVQITFCTTSSVIRQLHKYKMIKCNTNHLLNRIYDNRCASFKRSCNID